MLFDKFDNKTIINGVITAVDPLYIGSAGAETLDPTQVDGSVLKDLNGLPVIPGSSIKGVVRSDFEAIMRSVGKRVCNCFDDKDENCITKNALRNINDSKDSQLEKAERAYEESCEVCKLFGGRGTASKLQFKDCNFIGEKCIYEYRDGVGIDRKTGAAKSGVKYNFEIIPKGSKFNFILIAENLDEPQKKYLDYIIKTLESGELSVGGKTSRGLGRISLEVTEKNEMNADSLKALLGL